MKNRTVIGIVCMALAVAMTFFISPLVNKLTSDTTTVIRVSADVKQGAQITDKNIETVEVKTVTLPAGVITRKSQVIGKYAASNIYAGDYFTTAKIMLFESKRFCIIVISLIVVIAAGSLISISILKESTEGGFILGNTYNTAEGLTVEDVDTVYNLKGDSSRMTPARGGTGYVRYHEPERVYGFDDIDIVIEGSVGDKYTLVFGAGPEKSDHTLLVGQPISNPEVSWIPVDTVKIKKLTINRELYTTKDLGVSVKAKKTGVKCIVKSREYSRAAGVVNINYNGE